MNTFTLMEEAAKVITNRFLLSRVLTMRIRQLEKGSKPKIDVEEKAPFMETALQEIIAGKIELVGGEEFGFN